MKSNDCSGIWFTKCISISVFIIENHFVTPFDQTNAQNRIRIISVILRILSLSKNFQNLLTFGKMFKAICPISYNIRELTETDSGLADGRVFDNIETQARKSVISAAIVSLPFWKLENLNIVTGKGDIMTRYVNQALPSNKLKIFNEKSKFQRMKTSKVSLSYILETTCWWQMLVTTLRP